jgi:hypothetical protein
LLIDFSQVCSENWEQKSRQEVFEKLSACQKRSAFKVMTKESMVAKEINTTKKKSITLHCHSRKDALKASQELVRIQFLKAKCYKRLLREVFSCVQLSRQSETTVGFVTI